MATQSRTTAQTTIDVTTSDAWAIEATGVPTEDRCLACGSVMLFVRSHYQCDARGCPLKGQNQVPCCNGETAATCPV